MSGIEKVKPQPGRTIGSYLNRCRSNLTIGAFLFVFSAMNMQLHAEENLIATNCPSPGGDYATEKLDAFKRLCELSYQTGAKWYAKVSFLKTKSGYGANDNIFSDFDDYVRKVGDIVDNEILNVGVDYNLVDSNGRAKSFADLIQENKHKIIENFYAQESAIADFGAKQEKKYTNLYYEVPDKASVKAIPSSSCLQSDACFDRPSLVKDNSNMLISALHEDWKKKNKAYISKQLGRWDGFIENARQMSILDTWLTSWVYRKDYQQPGLAGPPSLQYFVLHPSVVYEHIDKQENGARDEFGLNLELLGVNDWDNETLPFGLSVGVLYTDRENVSSTAPSLMIHIDNEWSIGYVHRSDEDGGAGVFFSYSILSLPDKKKKYFYSF